MALHQNIGRKLFWINTFKVGIPFFIVVVIFSLLFNSASDIFSGNFDVVAETHFTNKKWVRFFLGKIVISIMYGMYTSNKKMK
ncbi:hypothetical protein BTO06_13550 [Tenacibaculum sp. SZ-18]|uniref:hypothetical protein n=1 Tax=Tenacibaculum sp. SZ-18 TaxID=754423 RepID=UPI000C2CE943|nr:hypothetical protein [Tenacibaculum sp. SZ-18]AUC16119.1 hypothetical protein BTO06_13550 [Tenacibaculum sp. SZ-18]